MILPIVQSLSLNIPNFNETESTSLIGHAGVAKIENGTTVLNPFLNNSVGWAIYGQPLHLNNSFNWNVIDFSSRFSFTMDKHTKTNYGDGFAFNMAPFTTIKKKRASTMVQSEIQRRFSPVLECNIVEGYKLQRRVWKHRLKK